LFTICSSWKNVKYFYFFIYFFFKANGSRSLYNSFNTISSYIAYMASLHCGYVVLPATRSMLLLKAVYFRVKNVVKKFRYALQICKQCVYEITISVLKYGLEPSGETPFPDVPVCDCICTSKREFVMSTEIMMYCNHGRCPN
jgi:hypothetical protein